LRFPFKKLPYEPSGAFSVITSLVANVPDTLHVSPLRELETVKRPVPLPIVRE
jgi:hypothetical protein